MKDVQYQIAGACIDISNELVVVEIDEENGNCEIEDEDNVNEKIWKMGYILLL